MKSSTFGEKTFDKDIKLFRKTKCNIIPVSSLSSLAMLGAFSTGCLR